MFPEALSNNSTSLSEEEDISGGGSSATKFQNLTCFNNPTTIFSSPTTTTTISPPLPPPEYHHHHQQEQHKIKRKRNLPGNPDPDAEVIALSPKSLLATNRFVCEICNKGFQRDQNLQLHRRGHNLPWKLKQKSTTDKKRVYVCPEVSCVHHDPSRALGDLTGIKKHFGRKHGEKKWKCEKCARKYAVQSDWKAHLKTCGTKEYRCDCGSLFSRKDSFITHRAFCDALAEESARLSSNPNLNLTPTNPTPTSTDHHHLHHPLSLPLHSFNRQHLQNPPPSSSSLFFSFTTTSTIHQHQENIFPLLNPTPLPPPISLLSSWKPPSHENPPHHQNPPHHHNPNTPTTPISSYFHESPPPNFLIDQTNHSVLPNPNASPHMSATALLQKAASVGSASISTTRPSQTQSVGHMTTAPQSLNELTGPLSQMGGPDQYLGFTTSSSAGNNNQSTWQKDDHLTRDFLGLAEGDHQHHHGGAGDDGGGRNGGDGGGNGGGGNVSQRGWSTGGVDFRTYDHDHSLLKQPQPSAFGFASTWGDC